MSSVAADDLVGSCTEGNHKLLKAQLAVLHLDPNEADDDGVTPLYIACGTAINNHLCTFLALLLKETYYILLLLFFHVPLNAVNTPENFDN